MNCSERRHKSAGEKNVEIWSEFLNKRTHDLQESREKTELHEVLKPTTKIQTLTGRFAPSFLLHSVEQTFYGPELFIAATGIQM